MEVKDIAFTGLGQAMSDLNCQDGELSVSHNIILDNGSMRPIWMPKANENLALQEGESLVYVHKTDDYRNFVVTKEYAIKVTNHLTMYYTEAPGVFHVKVFFQYPVTSNFNIHIRLKNENEGEDGIAITVNAGQSGLMKTTKTGVYTYVESSIAITEDDNYYYTMYAIEDPANTGTAETNDAIPTAKGLFYYTEDNTERKAIAANGDYSDDVNVTSIGNTLVISDGKGLEYSLFKDNAYKYLGTKPPEPVIRFTLESKFHFERYTGDKFNLSDIIDDDALVSGTGFAIKDDKIDSFSQMEAAMSAKVINLANEENNIIFPCFVRYAYRLYDGSYIMQSSPILLVPGTDITPAFLFKQSYDENWTGMFVFGSAIKIAVNPTAMEGISDWKDIVTSIDFFISEQINPRYSDSKINKVELLSASDAGKSKVYGNIKSPNMENPYGPKTFTELIEGNFGSGPWYTLSGYDLKAEDYLKRIKETSNFYKVRSIDIDNLSVGLMYLFDNDEEGSVDGVNLSTIVFEERLPDDYQTHDILSANYLYSYNSRLNAAGVSRFMFGGYNTTSMVMQMFTKENTYNYYTIYTHIKKNNREIVVKNSCDGVYWFAPMYLFYPDTDAYKMTIIKSDNPEDGNYYDGYVVELEKHPTLNGAVWFGGLKEIKASTTKLAAPSVTDNHVTVLNKIYTSELNNPFYFPLSGINTVGVGEISGIASVTKALSQGQFGQFPLYVFSSDGVWAMEVGSDGLYTSVKPISRDVCVNKGSITQTDNAVLFVSDKGVMIVNGSSVELVSGMMNGRSFDASSLAYLDKVFVKEQIPEGLSEINDFLDFTKVCRMAYDYSNGRIVLFNDERDYCYVYSLNSGTWATIGSGFDKVVNDYPDVYVQKGTDVIRLTENTDYNNKDIVSTLIVTRPIKLGDDGFKTVYEMVCRGAMDRRNGAVLLWGSHDGLNYTLVGDANGNRLYRIGGSGHRYFRIGVVGKMNIGETVSMCSMKFRRKYTNRLR